MKKMLCLLALTIMAVGNVCAFSGGFEFGIGSGYVAYGSDKAKEKNDQLNAPRQIVLNTNGGVHFKIADPLRVYAGVDINIDFRWNGGNHVYLLDYAGLVGFQLYPRIAGLVFMVDYALGCRTDFYELPSGSGSDAAEWGNGFRFGMQYDFSYHFGVIGPVVGVSWRRMPRGDGADNIFSIFLKLTIN